MEEACNDVGMEFNGGYSCFVEEEGRIIIYNLGSVGGGEYKVNKYPSVEK